MEKTEFEFPAVWLTAEECKLWISGPIFPQADTGVCPQRRRGSHTPPPGRTIDGSIVKCVPAKSLPHGSPVSCFKFGPDYVVDLLCDVRRTGRWKCGQLGRVICGSTHPDQVICSPYASFRDEKIAGIDADDMLQLVGVVGVL